MEKITPYLSDFCINGVGGMWGEHFRLSSVLQIYENTRLADVLT